MHYPQCHCFYWQTLANWGRDKINTDLTPDENSIQFLVFYSVLAGPDAAYSLDYTVSYGTGTISGSDTIELGDTNMVAVRINL